MAFATTSDTNDGISYTGARSHRKCSDLPAARWQIRLGQFGAVD
jgi:hypothetical protein